jgi:hypothetical protein
MFRVCERQDIFRLFVQITSFDTSCGFSILFRFNLIGQSFELKLFCDDNLRR